MLYNQNRLKIILLSLQTFFKRNVFPCPLTSCLIVFHFFPVAGYLSSIFPRIFGFQNSEILSHFWQRLVEEAGPSAREPLVVPPMDDNVLHCKILQPPAVYRSLHYMQVVRRAASSRAAFQPPSTPSRSPPVALSPAAALLRICEHRGDSVGRFFLRTSMCR